MVALVFGFVGICVQFLSSRVGAQTPVFGGVLNLNYLIYLVGAFICGFSVCILNTVTNPMLNVLGGGGNKGNQFIQIGGSLNSLTGTLTPMLVGVMIGEVTNKTSMNDVAPLLFVAMGVFALAFIVLSFLKLVEPEQEPMVLKESLGGALKFKRLIFGVIAIFLYVGVEIGIPGEMIFYVSNMDMPSATAVAGSLAAIYWLMMLVGRVLSTVISGKVTPRMQLTIVSSAAILFLLVAIFLPESITMHIYGEVPVKCLFLILCGLCTSVMWGGIFNLATEGLGKYTAIASGIFMTMVVGGGVMPLIQDAIARSAGYMASYWLVIAMVAYILWFTVRGSKK